MNERPDQQENSYSPEWKSLMKVLETHGLKEQFDTVQEGIVDPLSLDVSIAWTIAFLMDTGLTEAEARQTLLEAGVK